MAVTRGPTGIGSELDEALAMEHVILREFFVDRQADALGDAGEQAAFKPVVLDGRTLWAPALPPGRHDP